MARRKQDNIKETIEDETLVDVVGQVRSLQDYVEENSSKVLAIVGGIILVVAAILAYIYLYKQPRNEAAAEKIRHAQFAFDKQQYAIALEGDTINTDHGFLDIIDDYSGTESANLANYYAGISYLNLGNFDMAISFLEDFNEKGTVIPAYKYAALGDAYSEKGETEKALSNYRKAASATPNDYTTPLMLMKLGQYLEVQGQAEEAKKTYQKITAEYALSAQATEAEKYLGRLGK